MVQSSEVVYKDDKGHTADPIRGDQDSCLTTCSVILPKGVKAYCYANEDSERQDYDQFCAYEKDGFIYGAEGCCDKPCPGEECPDEPARKPEKIQTQSKRSSSSKSKTPAPQPLPQLIKIVLVLLAILLVVAGIFVSVDI
jgi:hypothetical protein